MRLHTPLLALSTLWLAAAPPAHAASRAFVFGTDFSTGSLSAVTTPGLASACDVASPHSDARLRFFGGQLFVINRFGADNIQIVDPVSYGTVRQFSVGNGANPYDIAVLSPTRAYVTRYERRELWIVDPSTGIKTGEIDLGGFADADGVPEMDRIAVVGPLAFVSLQRLDRTGGFVPTDSSLVAVIDTRTDALVDCDAVEPGVQAILLPRTNPVTDFALDVTTSRLLLGCAGFYGVLDGGIVAIDAAGLTSAGVVVSDAQLGGDCNDLVWLSPVQAYAIVSTPSFVTTLVRLDPASASVGPTLFDPGAFALSDIEWDGGSELWLCDSRFVGGAVRRFSTATDLALGAPLTCTLPPQGLAFDRASGPFADVSPAAQALALSAAWPQPARGPVRFSWTLARAGEARLEVFDALGRRVRVLAEGWQPAGPRELAWDLLDAQGRRISAGLYLLRARSGAGEALRRVVVSGR